MLIKVSVSAEPLTYVLDTKLLNQLETSGFSLAETLGHDASISKTADLYKEVSWYQQFADIIGKPLKHTKQDQLPAIIPADSGDIPNMVRLLRNFEDKGSRSSKDRKGGFYISQLSNNSHHPYTVEYDGDEPRHFDTRWLNSKFAYFKLIAIANRLDRAAFSKDTCGEVRFVYRLSYKSSLSSSSLPFFVNVVHEYPHQDNCAEFAKAWQIPPNNKEALLTGPLKNLTFRQLEVNFQALRFTSGYMHDFGGQAMYMQRVFQKLNNQLIPAALENTPNVLAIQKSPQLLEQFVDYLKQPANLKALDQGTLNINFDPEFLAKLSVSWSTLGRARMANRPYSTLFEDKQALVKSIDISQLKHIKSHDALVERLNNLTCMGCHQAGGTAGFHMLGKADEEFSHPFNRQQLALSPHAFAETFRRTAYTTALAKNQTPNPYRPHSVFSEGTWQDNREPTFNDLSLGQLCMDTQSFAGAPACKSSKARPTECRTTVKGKRALIGECVLKESIEAAGSVCWDGELRENLSLPTDRGTIPTYNFFSFQDKWKLKGAVFKDKKAYSCILPNSGAPLGRMSRKCSLNEEKLNIDLAHIPNEICANQGGKGFDLCAASGDSGACLKSKVSRAMLDTCHEERHCREDYICQQIPDYSKISAKDYVRKKRGRLINRALPKEISTASIRSLQDRNIGFCVPTYFLFNMRVDGHPSPETGNVSASPKFDRTKPLRGYR